MSEERDAATTEETVSVVVRLSPIVAELLAVLDLDVAHLPRTQHAPGKLSAALPSFATLEQRCARVLLQLADHAHQGVYRNGAWEQQWVVQAFGDGWLECTEPGDPYGRPDDEGRWSSLFRRPKRTDA